MIRRTAYRRGSTFAPPRPGGAARGPAAAPASSGDTDDLVPYVSDVSEAGAARRARGQPGASPPDSAGRRSAESSESAPGRVPGRVPDRAPGRGPEHAGGRTPLQGALRPAPPAKPALRRAPIPAAALSPAARGAPFTAAGRSPRPPAPQGAAGGPGDPGGAPGASRPAVFAGTYGEFIRTPAVAVRAPHASRPSARARFRRGLHPRPAGGGPGQGALPGQPQDQPRDPPRDSLPGSRLDSRQGLRPDTPGLQSDLPSGLQSGLPSGPQPDPQSGPQSVLPPGNASQTEISAGHAPGSPLDSSAGPPPERPGLLPRLPPRLPPRREAGPGPAQAAPDRGPALSSTTEPDPGAITPPNREALPGPLTPPSPPSGPSDGGPGASLSQISEPPGRPAAGPFFSRRGGPSGAQAARAPGPAGAPAARAPAPSRLTSPPHPVVSAATARACQDDLNASRLEARLSGALGREAGPVPRGRLHTMLAAAILLEGDLRARLSAALCRGQGSAGGANGASATSGAGPGGSRGPGGTNGPGAQDPAPPDPETLQAQVRRIASSFNPQVQQQLATGQGGPPGSAGSATATASQIVAQGGRRFRVARDPRAMEEIRIADTARSPEMLLTVLGACALSGSVSCYACASQGAAAVYYLVARGPLLPRARAFLLYAPFLELEVLSEHAGLLRLFRGIRRPQTLEGRPARLILNPACHYAVD